MNTRPLLSVAVLLLCCAFAPGQPVIGLTHDVHALAWAPAGDQLFAATYNFLYRIDVATRHVEAIFVADGIDQLDVVPDGRVSFYHSHTQSAPYHSAQLALLPANGSFVPLWDVYVAMGGGFDRVRWSPDGTRIATATQFGQVHDAATGAVVVEIAPLIGDLMDPYATGIDWLDDDRLILVLGGVPHLYSLSQQALLAEVPVPGGARVALPAAPGGAHVVAATSEALLVLEPSTGTVQAGLPSPLTALGSPALRALAWARDGSAFAAASFDHQIAVCLVAAQACTLVWERPAWFDGALAWQPGGTLLAISTRSAPNAPTLVLLDVAGTLAALEASAPTPTQAG